MPPLEPAPVENGPMLLLLTLLLAGAAWVFTRSMVRSMRASKARAATGGGFADFALAALVNAAKIDGRVNADERRAVAKAMRDLAGPDFDAQRVDAAFAAARLSKEELVDYLAAQSGVFTREQKVELLKALLTVFVADSDFDADEHSALVDYTAAVGFDRHTAPQTLRKLAGDMAKGRVT